MIPDGWFFEGANRPKALAHWKESPPQTAANGSSAVTSDACKNQIVVMQFLSPKGASSMKQLAEVALLAPEFAAQGVVIMGVCDARVDWTTAQAELTASERYCSTIRNTHTTCSHQSKNFALRSIFPTVTTNAGTLFDTAIVAVLLDVVNEAHWAVSRKRD